MRWTEARLQKKVINYLKKNGWYVAKFNDRYRYGIPDLYMAKDGVSAWIELKTDNGRVTKHQELEITRLSAAGMVAEIARSLNDVIDITERIQDIFNKTNGEKR